MPGSSPQRKFKPEGKHIQNRRGFRDLGWREFGVGFCRRVPPLCCKTCAVRPVFARMVGELRAADPSNVQGPVKQNASPGEQSEGPRPRWKPGQEQNPGPENQDNQHMPEQPRGYFPEIGTEKSRVSFQNKTCTFFSRKSVPESVPPNQKFTASSHPSSLCAYSFRDCVLSSRTERPQKMPSFPQALLVSPLQ